MYELLIKARHVLDSGQDLDATVDIAVSGSTIVAIEPEIAAGEAAQVTPDTISSDLTARGLTFHSLREGRRGSWPLATASARSYA